MHDTKHGLVFSKVWLMRCVVMAHHIDRVKCMVDRLQQQCECSRTPGSSSSSSIRNGL